MANWTVWYLFAIALFLFYLTMGRRRRLRIKRNRKRRMGERRRMNLEILKEAIGKKVTIMQDGLVGGYQGKVLDVQENWIKLEEKKNIRIINVDMIASVSFPKQ